MQLNVLKMRSDKIKQFEKKGITTIEDLINYLPRKYWDFRKTVTVPELRDGETSAIIGTVSELKVENHIVKLILLDENDQKFYVQFFHQEYMEKRIHCGDIYFVAGKCKVFYRAKIIANPIVFTKDVDHARKIYPVYSSIQGMSEEFLLKQIQSALVLNEKFDYLETDLIKKYDLMLRPMAYQQVHHPTSMEELKRAKKRLIFDRLFLFHYKLKEQEDPSDLSSHIQIEHVDMTSNILKKLPFTLTDGQRKVLNHLYAHMKEGRKVNTVVQADTGAGKTVVGFLLASIVIENGYLAVMAAPTVLLANQHYEEAKQLLEPFGIRVCLMTSELSKKEVGILKKELEDGNIDLLIGTHSVLNADLPMDSLGLILCDEEHKFGVERRNALDRKGVHKVSFSATPIPRSIFYAMNAPSIELNEIKTMPSGRKEMILKVEENDYDVYPELLKELKDGHQGYIVCPFVNPSEAELFQGVDNVESEFKKAKKYFKGYTVGCVHGKMKDQEIHDTLQKFRDNKIQLLVASQVIEVGLSVPNANFVAVKSANRFGFSSLLQILGRAKRSSLQPMGWLLSDDQEKMLEFSKCKNGFEVAKCDLKMRGCGHYLGTDQSGNNPILMFVLDNEKLNEEITEEINAIFADEKRRKRYFIVDEMEL